MLLQRRSSPGLHRRCDARAHVEAARRRDRRLGSVPLVLTGNSPASEGRAQVGQAPRQGEAVRAVDASGGTAGGHSPVLLRRLHGRLSRPGGPGAGRVSPGPQGRADYDRSLGQTGVERFRAGSIAGMTPCDKQRPHKQRLWKVMELSTRGCRAHKEGREPLTEGEILKEKIMPGAQGVA
jgi:hypothetical protein